MGKGVHDTILNARSEELRNLKFTMALATLNDETRQALAAAAENGQKSPFEKLTPRCGPVSSGKGHQRAVWVIHDSGGDRSDYLLYHR